MKLISGNVGMEATPAQSLDQLWAEAESLGRVSVDRFLSDGDYRVDINFSRRSGTTVYARGRDRGIAYALARAINEAREMGAGEER